MDTRTRGWEEAGRNRDGGRGERRMEGIKLSTGPSPVPLESGLRKS